MLNMAYQKVDFALDACWTFSATSSDKMTHDGVDALLKSTARCATLLKSLLFSSPTGFYEFSEKRQIETATVPGKTGPSIHLY